MFIKQDALSAKNVLIQSHLSLIPFAHVVANPFLPKTVEITYVAIALVINLILILSGLWERMKVFWKKLFISLNININLR